jgi:ATP-dependent DNA ligase
MSQIRTVGAERDIGRRKRRFLYGGTDGSNPVPSSGESDANLIFGANPELVVEVKYLTWTDENLLRQVVYEGLREYKDPTDVQRSVPNQPSRLVRRR